MRVMAARTRREFSAEFKAETVRAIIDGDSSIAEMGRRLDIAPSVLGRWVRQAQVNAGKGPKGDALTTAEKQELAQLRREVKQLRMERDILKKAAAFFAKESE
jgi:transposase